MLYKPWEHEMSEEEEDWLPEGSIESLAMEKELHPDETPEQTARRILRENTPAAVMKIVHLMQHGDTSRMQFEASKYITDRILGPTGSDAYDGDKDPVTAFVDDVVDYANQGAKKQK